MFTKKQRNILVVGCGRLGASLAESLSQKGFNVTIIDKDENSFRKLNESFKGYEVISDATDVDVLLRCGIRDSRMVIITTGSDNANSMIGQIASRIFGIEKVFIRLNDAEKERLIHGFNIDVIYPFNLSVCEFQRLAQTELESVGA